MNARHLFGTAIAVLSLAALGSGCGDGRNNNDGGTQQPYDAGQKPDSGTPNSNQPTKMTIDQVKYNHTPYGSWVEVDNVVVNEVIYAKAGNANAWRADFWVQDPAAQHDGLFISKFYTDLDNTYLPAPGDNISVSGWFDTLPPYKNQTGYRYVLGNTVTVKADAGSSDGLMHITKNSSGPIPTAFEVDGGTFGNANGGLNKANSSFAGVRVHIPGDRHITNYAPPALAGPNGKFYGFEITGGILVNTYKTALHAWTDAGTECDWGSHTGDDVEFPNGVSGTWDTYTFAGCKDNTSDPFNCPSGVQNYYGNVPGTQDAGYTYVLYPNDCADLQGTVH